MIILMFIYNLFASGCSCATGAEDANMGIVSKTKPTKSPQGPNTSRK